MPIGYGAPAGTFGTVANVFSANASFTDYKTEQASLAIDKKVSSVPTVYESAKNSENVNLAKPESFRGVSGKLPSKAFFFDSSNNVNAAFILESLSIAYSEKMQVIETFQTTYLQMFGKRPVNMNIGGTLLNTANYDWLMNMLISYNDWMRGTKNLINGSRLFLHWSNITVEVALLGMNVTENSQLLHQAKFSANLLLLSEPSFEASAVFDSTTLAPPKPIPTTSMKEAEKKRNATIQVAKLENTIQREIIPV